MIIAIETVEAAGPDWAVIINAIAAAVVLLMTTWMTLRMRQAEAQAKRAEAQAKRAEADRQHIKRTLRKIEAQTDGTVTASKKVIAIAAENLAVATGSEKDRKAATEAWQDYEAQVATQRAADALRLKEVTDQ